MRTILSLALLLTFVGCGSYKDVRVLSSESEGKNCEVINKLKGVNDFGSDQAAIKDLREKALHIGGNAVYVERIIPNGRIYEAHGFVYKCEESK